MKKIFIAVIMMILYSSMVYANSFSYANGELPGFWETNGDGSGWSSDEGNWVNDEYMFQTFGNSTYWDQSSVFYNTLWTGKYNIRIEIDVHNKSDLWFYFAGWNIKDKTNISFNGQLISDYEIQKYNDGRNNLFGSVSFDQLNDGVNYFTYSVEREDGFTGSLYERTTFTQIYREYFPSDPIVAPVPEPTTFILFIVGICGFLVFRSIRK